MLNFLSPAKVNLFLRICGQRSDGFHELISKFQAVTLFDRLSFSVAEEDGFLSSSSIPWDSNHLVFKALNLWREKTGICTPVAIHLDKKIPVEAGLGGGSSNAATTLWALNQLFQANVGEKILMEWGAELGSDVPFFFSHGTALCRGRGEIVEDLPPLPNQAIWLVKPPYGLSTAKVYQNFQEQEPAQGEYFNDLESAAYRLSPELLELKQDLLDGGASRVMLSGSGTSLICWQDSRPKCREENQCFPVQFLNRKLDEWY